MDDKLREDFYAATFRRYDGLLASGERANNKFDAEQVQAMPQLRERIADKVAYLGRKYHADMVVAVPDGANWLGIDVAWRLGASLLLLAKDEATKEVTYRDPNDQQRLETSDRLLIVEDIFRHFTNTRKVYALPAVRERTVGAIAILDRGDPEERAPFNLCHEAVFYELVPAILPCSSPLWRYAT